MYGMMKSMTQQIVREACEEKFYAEHQRELREADPERRKYLLAVDRIIKRNAEREARQKMMMFAAKYLRDDPFNIKHSLKLSDAEYRKALKIAASPALK